MKNRGQWLLTLLGSVVVMSCFREGRVVRQAQFSDRRSSYSVRTKSALLWKARMAGPLTQCIPASYNSAGFTAWRTI